MSQAVLHVKLNNIEKKIDKSTKQVEGLRSIVSELTTDMLGADQLHGATQKLDEILAIVKGPQMGEIIRGQNLRG